MVYFVKIHIECKKNTTDVIYEPIFKLAHDVNKRFTISWSFFEIFSLPIQIQFMIYRA